MNMLNVTQKANLKTLRDFLDANRDKIDLDMSTYCRVDAAYEDDFEELELKDFVKSGLSGEGTACGASMCMLGWAATIFIDQVEVNKDGYITEDWRDIGTKLFGTHNNKDTTGRWLFSSDWADDEENRKVFNTVDHALYRIDRVLAAETEYDYHLIESEFMELVG